MSSEKSEDKSLWGAYLEQLDKNPVITKLLTSAFVSFCGDLVGQKVVARQRFDLVRSAKFTFLGACTSPLVHFWYKFCDKFFAGRSRWLRLAVDQLGFSVTLNIIFFTLLATLNGHPEQAPSTIRRNLLPTMLVSWRVWPIAMYFNFNYVPANLRVLFGNLVGFFWSIFLSMKK